MPAAIGPAPLQVIYSHEWPSRALRVKLVIGAVAYVDLEILKIFFLPNICIRTRPYKNVLDQKKSMNEVWFL